jgi:hypothetical protein
MLHRFHESIPHTETNLSPTYSEYDGPIFHAFGAEAYTYTKADDAVEMLLKHMEATKRLKGEDKGPIDK